MIGLIMQRPDFPNVEDNEKPNLPPHDAAAPHPSSIFSRMDFKMIARDWMRYLEIMIVGHEPGTGLRLTVPPITEVNSFFGTH